MNYNNLQEDLRSHYTLIFIKVMQIPQRIRYTRKFAGGFSVTGLCSRIIVVHWAAQGHTSSFPLAIS
jgi:hypothetical protein